MLFFMITKDGEHLKRKFYKGKKFSQQTGIGISLEPKSEGFKGKCNSCHACGHKKANYKKYTAWLENKGTPFTLVCLNIMWLMCPLTPGG